MVGEGDNAVVHCAAFAKASIKSLPNLVSDILSQRFSATTANSVAL